MPKDDSDNNPLSLIALCRKPLKWRVEATRVLINNSQRIKTLQLEVSAVIGLAVLILGVVIHNALT